LNLFADLVEYAVIVAFIVGQASTAVKLIGNLVTEFYFFEGVLATIKLFGVESEV
jgi:hypothetical protein